MWCVIKLRDRNETPCGTEIIDGIEYYVDDMFDLEDGRIYFGFKTKKDAQEQVKIWKWCNKWDDIKYRYIVEKEENI